MGYSTAKKLLVTEDKWFSNAHKKMNLQAGNMLFPRDSYEEIERFLNTSLKEILFAYGGSFVGQRIRQTQAHKGYTPIKVMRIALNELFEKSGVPLRCRCASNSEERLLKGEEGSMLYIYSYFVCGEKVHEGEVGCWLVFSFSECEVPKVIATSPTTGYIINSVTINNASLRDLIDGGMYTLICLEINYQKKINTELVMMNRANEHSYKKMVFVNHILNLTKEYQKDYELVMRKYRNLP